MSAPHNPSAFPVNPTNDPAPGAYEPDPGMSLRDWFAGQALVGAAFKALSPIEAADAAYRHADAMLAAREQKA